MNGYLRAEALARALWNRGTAAPCLPWRPSQQARLLELAAAVLLGRLLPEVAQYFDNPSPPAWPSARTSCPAGGTAGSLPAGAQTEDTELVAGHRRPSLPTQIPSFP